MHHYPFHPGDYLLATCHLEPMHDLTYRRLLDYYYSEEKEIPKETCWVSKRIRMPQNLVEDVLREFFKETENGWKHTRCEEEIESYNHRSEISKSNGMKGGRPKKTQQKPSDNLQVISGLAKKTQSGSSSGYGSQDGREVQEERKKPLSREEMGGWIERIRTSYPRQGAQQDCAHAIRTAIDAGRQTPEQILADVEACAKWVKILEPTAEAVCSWVPCAEKFFGGRQWTDPKKFQAMVERQKEAQNGTKTTQRRDSGDLNADGRYS